MSKKKKTNHKKSSPRSSKNKGGKFDLMAILSDKDTLIGVGIGVLGGAAIEVFGAKFFTNNLVRSGVESILPAVATGLITKNKNSTIAAAGAGAAVGLGAIVIKKIAEMSTPKAATTPAAATGVKGMIGENIFTQTSGETEMIPVSGEVDTFYPVQGDEEAVAGQLSGDDDFVSVSGGLDELV